MKPQEIKFTWEGKEDPTDPSGRGIFKTPNYTYLIEFESFTEARTLFWFVQSVAEYYYKQGVLDTHSRLQYNLDMWKEEQCNY